MAAEPKARGAKGNSAARPSIDGRRRAAAATHPPTAMDKLTLYRSFLQQQGFRTDANDDFLGFAFEGGNYVLGLEDGDPTYFRLIFPCFWSIDSPDERARALVAATQTTQAIKVAKVFLDQRPAIPLKNVKAGEDTTAAVELFLAKPEDFEGVFQRSLRVLQIAAQHFRTAMAAGRGADGDLLEQMRRALGLPGDGPAAPPA
jgi:hypothetical protein